VDAVIAGYRKKRGEEGDLKSLAKVNEGLGTVSKPPTEQSRSTLITVPVDEIDLCDINPRQQPNKAFEKIKESIRIDGLDNLITITRLPGCERFMVAGDGNTRLKALFELAAEERKTLKPGEKPRFADALCIFKPYTSDIDMLVTSLRMNVLVASSPLR
jgi:hypothetical protein